MYKNVLILIKIQITNFEEIRAHLNAYDRLSCHKEFFKNIKTTEIRKIKKNHLMKIGKNYQNKIYRNRYLTNDDCKINNSCFKCILNRIFPNNPSTILIYSLNPGLTIILISSKITAISSPHDAIILTVCR